MTDAVSLAMTGAPPAASARPAGPDETDPKAAVTKRLEQLIWAEMLSHAGLEKALTMNGGEAASSFSRYVVEAIAADLAEQHPLGISGGVGDAPPKELVALYGGADE